MVDKRVIRLLNDLQQRAATLDRKMLRERNLSKHEQDERHGILFNIGNLKQYQRTASKDDSTEPLHQLYLKAHSTLEKDMIAIGVNDIDLTDPLFAILYAEKRIADCMDEIAKEHGWFTPYIEGKRRFWLSDIQVDDKGKEFVIINNQDKAYVKTLSATGDKYVSLQTNPYLDWDDIHKSSQLQLFLLNHFDSRITDAIQAVKDGYAHCIIGPKSATNVFSGHAEPVIMLDKQLGAQKRQELLHNLQSNPDMTFGWGLQYGAKNSFGLPNYVTETGDLVVLEGTPACFATKQEAEALQAKLLHDAEQFLKNLFKKTKPTLLDKLKGTQTVTPADRLNDELKAQNIPFVVDDLIYRMLNDDVTSYDVNKWSESARFEVVQTVRAKATNSTVTIA